jgi:UPF0716 protein FxsA
VFWKLLLAMTVIPAVELYLLIQLGQWMGALETVLLIVVTGAIGAALAKREGFSVLRQLKEDAQSGIPPADRLVEGVMVLIGGVLLLTPGVLTDLTGFALIAPFTRRPMAPLIKRWLASKVKIGGLSMGSPGWGPGVGQTVQRPRPEPRPAPDADGPRFEHPEG